MVLCEVTAAFRFPGSSAHNLSIFIGLWWPISVMVHTYSPLKANVFLQGPESTNTRYRSFTCNTFCNSPIQTSHNRTLSPVESDHDSPNMMASSVAVQGSGMRSGPLLLSVGNRLSGVVGLAKVLVMRFPSKHTSYNFEHQNSLFLYTVQRNICERRMC